MIHDAPEHRWRRWWNAYQLRAIGDLFADFALPSTDRIRR